MARHVKNHKKRSPHGTAFWDQEYTKAEHLALSTEASDDLEKFCRWLERESKRTVLNPLSSAIDLGCGNGRNLVYLAREFGMRGIGYDSSSAAIKEAKRLSQGMNLTYGVRSIAGALDVEDESQMLALDMMSSHFLKTDERIMLRNEIHRVLKPGGYLFMKTFLRDGDLHSKRLISENPAEEENSYIHPVIGVQEHVYSEEELLAFLEEKFIIHKTYASHKHISRGKARKRRTISVYAQKDPYAK
jgi:SAM-dependent methyltransferase